MPKRVGGQSLGTVNKEVGRRRQEQQHLPSNQEQESL
jgi:hypothetical protein